MSDWEKGARNAVKKQFEGIHLRGCYFHFTQNIWRKIQKLSLSKIYHANEEFRTLIRAYMSLPFLPEDQILAIYNELEMKNVIISTEDAVNFSKFKKYVRRQWITSTPSRELSVYGCQHTTNNGAEVYQGKLKKDIVVSHPRIWAFVEILNNTIEDIDLDIERLSNGIDITRNRKMIDIQNENFRRDCRNKLENIL